MSVGLAKALQRMKSKSGGAGTLVNCLEEELDAQQQEQLSKLLLQLVMGREMFMANQRPSEVFCCSLWWEGDVDGN
jgi:hypothetical protein